MRPRPHFSPEPEWLDDRGAVALQYDGVGAPRVTAKGRGDVAEEILRIAREHDIPIQQSRGLTELLSTVDLGDEIPPVLYVAIAEVLSFAYALSGKSIEDPGALP